MRRRGKVASRIGFPAPEGFSFYPQEKEGCGRKMDGRKEEVASMAAGGAALPSWKLYDNPFYDHRRRRRHRQRWRSSSEEAATISELHFQVGKLKVELDNERTLRKKAEALNREIARELSEEKMRREAKERAYEDLAAEISRRKETEDAERGAFAASPMHTGFPGGGEKGGAWGQRRSPSQRKESPENPHIRRGMKGFVEFPRGLRVRALGSPCSRESEEDGAAKVDCQMAQLRVLLKGRTPPGSASSRVDGLLV